VPAATQAPTPSTRVVSPGGLPVGWRVFTNQAGNNRVGVPPGFQARTRQRYHATVLEEHGGGLRVFTVRSQTPSAPLPQASRRMSRVPLNFGGGPGDHQAASTSS
jgi:hypothetical protein